MRIVSIEEFLASYASDVRDIVYNNISESNRRIWFQLLNQHANCSFSKESQDSVLALASSNELQEAVQTVLPKMKECLNPKINPLGLVVLKNLPQDKDVPPTGIPKTTCVSELVTLSIAFNLGYPIPFAYSKEKNLIHNLIPTRENRFEQTGRGSCFLTWHIDDAFSPNPPKYVILYCLRGDTLAKTLFARLNPSQLSQKTVELLSSPNFIFRHMNNEIFRSFDSHGDLSPIFTKDENKNWESRFDPLYTAPKDGKSEGALRELVQSIKSHPPVSICLQPGEAALFCNRMTIHARSRFSPRFDGSDRWIQKIFIQKDSVLINN